MGNGAVAFERGKSFRRQLFLRYPGYCIVSRVAAWKDTQRGFVYNEKRQSLQKFRRNSTSERAGSRRSFLTF